MVKFFDEYAREGVDSHALARSVAGGALAKVRRGAYAKVNESLSEEQAHRRLIAATMPRLRPGAVLSHTSAGLLHGIPALGNLGPVTILRDGSGQGRSSPTLHLRRDTLEGDVVRLDGLDATSLARTASDLARETTWVRAIMQLDHALRGGVTHDELTEMVGRRPRRRGNQQLRAAIEFADGLAASPGESWSRVVFARAGLPQPVLQFEVVDPDGVLLGIADFAWPDLGLLGEFDGRVKYGDLVEDGQSGGDVLWAEKRREDSFREQGWVVLRWVWADLRTPEELVARWHRAYARARAMPRVA